MSSLKVSHPYKGKRHQSERQAEGKEPPSWGSGGPSCSAVGLGQQKGSVWR